MKSEWRVVPLRHLVGFISKGIAPAYAEVESATTVRVLNQKCNRNFQISYAESRLHDIAKKKVPAERFLRQDDILINSTGTGTAGRIAQVKNLPCDTIVDGHMIILRTNGVVGQRYLGHALKAHLWEVLQLDEGSTGQTELNRERLLDEIMIDYPASLIEQNVIVSILDCIDEKIALNKQINDNLLQQAQLLFKTWFVDFEPYNGTRPSDWEVVPLETIVDFQNGYAFKSKELLNTPSSDCYQVFKQGHIARGGGFISDGTKSWYPKKLASKLEKFVLRKGDILMAMTDMKDKVAILGNTAIMPIDNEYILNQRVGLLRANGYKGISYPFIYLLTNSADFLVNLRNRAHSGVQVNLSSAEIKDSQIVLPSEKVNLAFSNMTLPMFEAIISNQLVNHELVKLREALLPKLMSGEIDVSDVQL